MYLLYIITALLLAISFLKDKKKSIKALKIAKKKFTKILPAFSLTLILVSIVLALLPDSIIAQLLDNENKAISLALASLTGSITMMPGFITFPLCGVLLKKGVSYMVLSAFTTTLMMVGILTFPVEQKYLGTKVTVIRNVISFLIALIVALATGIVFGEVL